MPTKLAFNNMGINLLVALAVFNQRTLRNVKWSAKSSIAGYEKVSIEAGKGRARVTH